MVEDKIICLRCHKVVDGSHKGANPDHGVYALGRHPSKKPVNVPHIRNFLREVPLPATYDLRVPGLGVPGIGIGPIYDQQTTGSCVAFAWANIKMWQASRDAGVWVPLSQEFIYDVGRNDNGSCPQSGMDSIWGPQCLQTHGTCPLPDMPYLNSENCATPSEQANIDAANYKVTTIAQITTSSDMMQVVYQLGEIGIGIPVYNEIMSVGSDGIIPMPTPGEESIGGHELAICGFTIINSTPYFIIKNSWYEIPGVLPWGDKGCGYLPVAYMDQCLPTGDGDSFSAVDAGAPTPPPPSGPAITVYPISVQQGQSVTVTGSGFTPSATVNVSIFSSGQAVLGSAAQTDAKGSFAATVSLNVLNPGTYTIQAIETLTGLKSNIVSIIVTTIPPPQEFFIVGTATFDGTVWSVVTVWAKFAKSSTTMRAALAPKKATTSIIFADAFLQNGVWAVKKVYFHFP